MIRRRRSSRPDLGLGNCLLPPVPDNPFESEIRSLDIILCERKRTTFCPTCGCQGKGDLYLLRIRNSAAGGLGLDTEHGAKEMTFRDYR